MQVQVIKSLIVLIACALSFGLHVPVIDDGPRAPLTLFVL